MPVGRFGRNGDQHNRADGRILSAAPCNRRQCERGLSVSLGKHPVQGNFHMDQIQHTSVGQNRSPFDYRRALEAAAMEERQSAEDERMDFWIDTCREPREFHIGSAQVRELNRTHGCALCAPTHLQTQEVLQALDTALPFWDRDHPELFYETLKLNFPELVRTH
jgi:hypothetical protein